MQGELQNNGTVRVQSMSVGLGKAQNRAQHGPVTTRPLSDGTVKNLEEEGTRYTEAWMGHV